MVIIVSCVTLGEFTNYVDKILAFFDHLPSCVDIFYGIQVDRKWRLLDYLPTYLPTSSCKRILWTPPYLMFFLFICSFRNWWFSTNPETFGSCDRTSWGNCSNAKGLWVHTFQTHFSRPTSQGSSKSSQPTSISLR